MSTNPLDPQEFDVIVLGSGPGGEGAAMSVSARTNIRGSGWWAAGCAPR